MVDDVFYLLLVLTEKLVAFSANSCRGLLYPEVPLATFSIKYNLVMSIKSCKTKRKSGNAINEIYWQEWKTEK